MRHMLASAIGYAMGSGAIILYSPMIYKLLQSKSADGFSVQTWVMNLVGLTLCVAYPFRKGFPLSTFLENVALTMQSVIALSLVCIYKGYQMELIGGLGLFSIMCYYLFLGNLPSTLFRWIHILSIIICNYALVPQIYLNWKQKQVTWSAFTALLSAGGNLIRVFTTLQLTQDMLMLGGYVIGWIMNMIMLFQIYIYRLKK